MDIAYTWINPHTNTHVYVFAHPLLTLSKFYANGFQEKLTRMVMVVTLMNTLWSWCCWLHQKHVRRCKTGMTTPTTMTWSKNTIEIYSHIHLLNTKVFQITTLHTATDCQDRLGYGWTESYSVIMLEVDLKWANAWKN